MKIADKTIRKGATLSTVGPGDVVRLANGRVYLIGNDDSGQKLLINAETGLSHAIQRSSRTECTVLDATLSIDGVA